MNPNHPATPHRCSPEFIGGSKSLFSPSRPPRPLPGTPEKPRNPEKHRPQYGPITFKNVQNGSKMVPRRFKSVQNRTRLFLVSPVFSPYLAGSSSTNPYHLWPPPPKSCPGEFKLKHDGSGPPFAAQDFGPRAPYSAFSTLPASVSRWYSMGWRSLKSSMVMRPVIQDQFIG